jgi:hypothetical protein
VSLFWPDNSGEVVTTEPRLHALVVGVGDYHHLGLGVPKPATFLNGLAPLTITTPSARRIARWLEETYENPAQPLGSIELLLSPNEFVGRSDGANVNIEDSTMANIEAAFKRWYARCNSNEANIAFFYFAGHGISTIASQYLLPSDFGDPEVPNDWDNCIDATGMQAGMFKCAANTQLFFFDACRDAPISALTQRNPNGKHLVSSSLANNVGVSAAYKAASEGRKAYGRDGEETFFCKALILCLDGVAARKAGPDWRVDTANLGSALASVVDVLAKIENLPLSCDTPGFRPVALHYPPAPRVLVKIDCEPDGAGSEATIMVTQGATELSSPAGEQRPWMGEMEVGDAHIEVTFQNFAPEIKDDLFLPPTYELDVIR